MNSKVADLALVLTALIWGSAFPVSQYAIDSNMSTSLILLLRFSIASIILLILFFKKIKTITKKEFQYGIIAGAFLFLGFYTQTIGLKYTTPSNNAFITAIYVIMVPFITMFVFKKRPKTKFFFLPLITFLGVVILTYSPSSNVLLSKGDLLTLLCALFFALHISYLGIVSKKVDVIKMTFLQMITASVLSLLFFVFYDKLVITNIDYTKGILSILYLGIFSTCLCFFIQTYAQSNTSPSKAAMILSTEALFGSLFSVILKIEPFTINLLIGGSLILLTIFAAETDFSKFKKNKKN
ncbi:MAG: DMT family transporter [Pleomorphochaeta sp.]